MDIYHIWFDLNGKVKDIDLAERLERFLTAMKQRGLIADHRLTRRKLGFGPADLGEFHLMIEVNGLAQLDQAFAAAAARADPVEELPHAVNSAVKDFRAALYRDFPDPIRERGQERF